MFGDLALARGDGRYPRLMRALGGVKLLILDDWGLEPPGPEQRHDMLEIVEDRYGRGATPITSQIPVNKWGSVEFRMGDVAPGERLGASARYWIAAHRSAGGDCSRGRLALVKPGLPATAFGGKGLTRGPTPRHPLHQAFDGEEGLDRPFHPLVFQKRHKWHQLIGQPTLADAILDRLIHNARRLQLSGDSLRKQRAAKTGAA